MTAVATAPIRAPYRPLTTLIMSDTPDKHRLMDVVDSIPSSEVEMTNTTLLMIESDDFVVAGDSASVTLVATSGSALGLKNGFHSLRDLRMAGARHHLKKCRHESCIQMMPHFRSICKKGTLPHYFMMDPILINGHYEIFSLDTKSVLDGDDIVVLGSRYSDDITRKWSADCTMIFELDHEAARA